MKTRISPLMMMAVITVSLIVLAGVAMADEETAAQAGEQVGVEGTFVRVAASEEGWVVVGYRIANESVGQEWMLLDVGMTLTKDAETRKVTRDDIKLVTPKGEVIDLPTQEEFEKVQGELAPLVKRSSIVGDSINYFPPTANLPCTIQMFATPGMAGRRLAYDEVELSKNRACVGRLYFQVPGGIELGNYNFDVRIAGDIIKVPMEIMNKEREKQFTEEWKAAREKEKKEKDNK